MDSEPGILLPFLTTKRGLALGALRTAIEGLVGDRCGHLSVTRVRAFADALARLVLSYVMTAAGRPGPGPGPPAGRDVRARTPATVVEI